MTSCVHFFVCVIIKNKTDYSYPMTLYLFFPEGLTYCPFLLILACINIIVFTWMEETNCNFKFNCEFHMLSHSISALSAQRNCHSVTPNTHNNELEDISLELGLHYIYFLPLFCVLLFYAFIHVQCQLSFWYNFTSVKKQQLLFI